MRTLPIALGLALSAAALQAQSPPGASAVGDLYLYSPAIQGLHSAAGAVVRIDPLTGVTTEVVDTFTTPGNTGAAAWDAWRGGLVFCAGLVDVFEPRHLWLLKPDDTLEDLGQVHETLWNLAPSDSGRLYLRRGSDAAGLVSYLDTDGVLEPLLAVNGVDRFNWAPGSFHHTNVMIWHAPSRSLISAAGGLAVACGGGFSSGVVFRKVTLSADGTRAVGPVTCSEFEVSSSGELPMGIARMPDGDLLVQVDTNNNGPEPRLVRLDPWSLQASAFAHPDYFGDAAIRGGTWSSERNAAVVLDTFNDDLRVFASGSSGAGITLTPSIQVSAGGSSGEVATLVEADADPCAGAFTAYGDGLAGSGGFEPVLHGSGCPLSNATVQLHMAGSVGGAQAALFIGPAVGALPFKGGTLHVDPITVTLNLVIPGAPGVAGAGAVSFPVLLPPGVSGVSVFLQAAFADVGAPVGVSLTAGLELAIG